MNKRKAAMTFLIAVGALIAGFSTAWFASSDVRYLTRAGFEETYILSHREPITRLVADSATTPERRRQLQLVLDARDFAGHIGLEAGRTYTQFTEVPRDTLLLVLSASPRNCLCPYTWKYPIVGRIPYKGFFDQAMARREAAKLEGAGYDVYLRPSSAFSTLGWFNDPLLSTALTGDSMELAALVLHEIGHNTLYVKSATPFNESFAQLVGYRGAEAFFRSRGDSATARRAADRWHDEVILSRYYRELAERLDSLYHATSDSAAVDAGRADIARWARAQLEGPVGQNLRTYQIGPMPDRPINNARIIAARIYRTRLDLFQDWYEEHGGSVEESVAALRRLMENVPGDSAYDVLQRGVETAAPQ